MCCELSMWLVFVIFDLGYNGDFFVCVVFYDIIDILMLIRVDFSRF